MLARVRTARMENARMSEFDYGGFCGGANHLRLVQGPAPQTVCKILTCACLLQLVHLRNVATAAHQLSHLRAAREDFRDLSDSTLIKNCDKSLNAEIVTFFAIIQR